MATPYNGSAAGIAAHEAPTITLAQPTDQVSEEAFNVGLRKLCDYVAYLNSKGALLDAINVFTQTQQLSGGDLELTKATVQALLKAGGGKLQVGTKAGNASDVELLVNGVVRAILRASDGRIGGLLDPAQAQDADTMAARDAAIAVEAAARSSADTSEATARANADTAHANLANPHSATSAATASRMVLRDAAGRAQFADPSADADAATKAYVDGRFPLTWNRITAGTGWTNEAGAGEFQWAKDAFGFIHLRGSMLVGQTGASATVATLPAGARPAATRSFGDAVKRALASAGVALSVNAIGSVMIPSVDGPVGDRYYFDGIYFAGEQ